MKKEKVVQACKKFGFAGCFNVDSYNTGGGLALMWRNECDIVITDSLLHYIDFEVSIEQVGRWRYKGYYGCPERERRREAWSIIRDLAGRSSLPWCIIGGFNDMMLMEEKQGGSAHPRRLIDGFVETVNDCQLMDMGFNGNMFTWERARGTPRWMQERLDRGLVNKQWKDMFPFADITVMDVSSSDHLPLYLQLNRKMYALRTHRFRFGNMWVKEKECLNIIQLCWSKMRDHSITDKIQYCWLKLEE